MMKKITAIQFVLALFVPVAFLVFSCKPTQENYNGYNGIYKTDVNGKEFRLVTNTSVTIRIDTVPVITQTDFEYVRGEFNTETNERLLVIKLSEAGKTKFADLTRENLGKPIAIILKNELVSMPVVETEIPNGIVIIPGLDRDIIISLVGYFNP